METGLTHLGNGLYYYLHPTQGNVITGWKKIDGAWYYFNKEAGGTKEKGIKEKGFMRTGWFNDNGRWYYFSDTYDYNDYGQMKTGFIFDGGGYYYLDENNTSNIGVMKTGWQKLNGYWYHFNTSTDSGVTGMMKKGWQKIGGTWYYFSIDDGIMAADKWIDGYYLNSDGAWIPGLTDTNSNSQIVTFADGNFEAVNKKYNR